MIEPHILKLPTPRLLAYYKKHYRNRHGAMWYRYDTCGYITKEEYDEFMTEHEAIKQELDSREHVES